MKHRQRDCSWVPGEFENISPNDFKCSSDPETDYNCIAWAAGKTNRPWWPEPTWPYFWPAGLPKSPAQEAERLAHFISAFKMEGYRVCFWMRSRYQRGYEKVAIYVNEKGRATHAARMLPTGVWSSKLGNEEDIEHKDLQCIQGKAYGRVAVILKRELPGRQGTDVLAKFHSLLSRISKRALGRF